MSNKTERLKFWLDEKDLRQLDRQARKAKMNRSEYIRFLVSNCRVIHAADINYEQYYAEFKELGDELNRYLYAMNTTGIFNEKKLDNVCNRILERMKDLETEISEKLIIEIQKAKGGTECETETIMSRCE